MTRKQEEPFLSAAELGISTRNRSALIQVLQLLETGQARHVNGNVLDRRPDADDGRHLFNMGYWAYPAVILEEGGRHSKCGTVYCIGGLAQLFGARLSEPVHGDKGYRLMQLLCVSPFAILPGGLSRVTPSQAAKALRNYLVTGNPFWSRVLAGQE
jgi:hypothetical protein